jgi:hypothetical protein
MNFGWRAVLQTLVRVVVVIKVEVALQPNLQLRHRGIVLQVNVFVLGATSIRGG